MQFKELKLDSRILKSIIKSGFSIPTEIQSKAIPVVLSGADLMASAQTGTGKTAAFVLPALHLLLDSAKTSGKGPRVLILTPTRELAVQVNKNIVDFSRFLKIPTGSILGGMPYGPQFRMLKKPLDLLVATPGRLLDHIERGKINLSRVEILILDEADRMLDMGFVDAVKDIAIKTPKSRQTLLFSATLEGRVLKIANQIQKKPISIALASNNERHKLINQCMYHADSNTHKQKILEHLLKDDRFKKILIFTATKRGAEKLAKTLTLRNYKNSPLHGDLSQSKRKQSVEKLSQGKINILVATDVASRGLDIKEISHVVNYDLPIVAEDYIHRIGRTGRAGAKGYAISLVGSADWKRLFKIEKMTGCKIKREVIDGLEPAGSEPKQSDNAKPSTRKRRRSPKTTKAINKRKPGQWRKSKSGKKKSKSQGAVKAA